MHARIMKRALLQDINNTQTFHFIYYLVTFFLATIDYVFE